jgi:hypothetical protein
MTMTTTSDDVDKYILYNEEYRVLICREHQHCLSPKNVTLHLRRSHEALPLSLRKKIVADKKHLDLRRPTALTGLG